MSDYKTAKISMQRDTIKQMKDDIELLRDENESLRRQRNAYRKEVFDIQDQLDEERRKRSRDALNHREELIAISKMPLSPEEAEVIQASKTIVSLWEKDGWLKSNGLTMEEKYKGLENAEKDLERAVKALLERDGWKRLHRKI